MGSLRGSFILNNMAWLFNGSRSLDSSWSWVVCFSAAVTSSINIGFTLSFGVFLPELMSYFNETIERTGKKRNAMQCNKEGISYKKNDCSPCCALVDIKMRPTMLSHLKAH